MEWMKHAIKETLLIIISSSVSLEAMFLGDCLPMENWQLPRQICCAKVAQLCCASDIGL